MRSFLVGMIRYVLDMETIHPLTLTVKAQEELGEFSEAMLYEHGYLRHKETKPGDLYDELADTFMVMITAAAKTTCGVTDPEQVVNRFEEALAKKFEKYKKIIEND